MQVIVLVGTGWSYMTPFLRDREKRILMVVIPLQVRHAHCRVSCQAHYMLHRCSDLRWPFCSPSTFNKTM